MKTEFSNSGITIRKVRPDDVMSNYEAVKESINELSPWFSCFTDDYSIDDSKKWVAGRDREWGEEIEFSFAVVDSATDRFLGFCGLNQYDKTNMRANIGYWIRTSESKKGLCAIAVKLLIKFGFEELKLQRLELVIDLENKASQRVAEKLGAVREGILRNRLRTNHGNRDGIGYSLIP